METHINLVVYAILIFHIGERFDLCWCKKIKESSVSQTLEWVRISAIESSITIGKCIVCS